MKQVTFLVLMLSAFAFTGCSNGKSVDAGATPAPVPAEFAGKTNPLGVDAATAGAEVFKSTCESCHGPQGHGDGVAGQGLDPKPRNLAELQAATGDDFLFWRIYSGKPGASMIAWNGVLTEEEIWQVVSFIRTLK